jgi:hypothetical protein
MVGWCCTDHLDNTCLSCCAGESSLGNRVGKTGHARRGNEELVSVLDICVVFLRSC